jgi:hypothetical protein
LLNRVVARLAVHGCGKTIDTGWTNADLEVFHDPWKVVKICTAQEEHGGGNRLIRIRYRHRLGGLTKAIALLGVIAAFVGLNVGLPVALACLAGVTVGLVAARWSGRRLLQRLANIVDELALEMGLTRCHSRSVGVAKRPDEPCPVVAECEAV